MMSTILLSVKPEYADRIFRGIKLYEYRKCLPQKQINKIIIYATFPTMKIIGEVNVIGILSGSRTAIWEKTKKNAGISRVKYREYFKGCKIAYAHQLENAITYDVPKTLEDLGIAFPPQSFIYIGE